MKVSKGRMLVNRDKYETYRTVKVRVQAQSTFGVRDRMHKAAGDI